MLVGICRHSSWRGVSPVRRRGEDSPELRRQAPVRVLVCFRILQ